MFSLNFLLSSWFSLAAHRVLIELVQLFTITSIHPPTCKNPKITEVMVIVKKKIKSKHPPLAQTTNHPTTKAKQNMRIRDYSVRVMTKVQF